VTQRARRACSVRVREITGEIEKASGRDSSVLGQEVRACSKERESKECEREALGQVRRCRPDEGQQVRFNRVSSGGVSVQQRE
jgi:hypothetical protein